MKKTKLFPMPADHRHLHNAAKLEEQGIFPGSPMDLFDAGRLSLMVLLHAGLYPNHRVLEIGCGALRSGYWIIHFLQRHGYCGIEPNERMLHAGLANILPAHLLDGHKYSGKAPKFLSNDQFDPSGFGRIFHFFLCCSIWSHAAKGQIEIMLDRFLTHTDRDARFLTSYIPAGNDEEDYKGETWVGRSHESNQKGSVRHSLHWIRAACQLRGLVVSSLPATYDFSNQTWLMIERGE
jgi:hypothetical protein